MFLSIVLPVTALETLEQPALFGREAHAFFLDAVRRASPTLAETLHADEQRKPFTVSGLRQLANSGRTRLEIRQGQSYFLRVTSLAADLSRLLLESVLPQLPETVRLGQARFHMGKPITDAAAHAWAGQTDAETLSSKWFGHSARASSRIDVEFVSPTAIKQRGRLLTVPTPATVFQSWLMAWNAYASPPFENDLIDLIEREVAVSRYHLKTMAIELGAGTQLGFVGRCGFTCFAPDHALWRTLNLLADFAFFCGTGYKTTQGMGQTRKIELVPRLV